MKKFSLIIVTLFLCIIVARNLNAKEIDFHNFPKTQDNYVNQNKPKVTNIKPSYSSGNVNKQTTTDINYKLDAIAGRALNASVNHDQAALNKCSQDFVNAGVENIYPPQVVSKKTPQCPPIKMELNGRTLSGSTCVKMGYIYKGKTYWKGYCKP